jgi:hypothetical protein
MTALEDRLRDAYAAAAATVPPQAAGAVPGRAPVPGRRAWLARFAVPLVAATAVAAIVIAAAVVVPRAWPGRSAHHGSDAVAGPVAASAGPPRYLVALLSSNPGGNLTVISTATGEVISQVGPPAPHLDFDALASLGGDRQFVVAASDPAASSGSTCQTRLYQFRLTAAGRITAFRPLAVPSVPGRMALGLAGSADGRYVSYATLSCSKAAPQTGHLGLVGLAARQIRTWTFGFPAEPGNFSLTAHGGLVSFISTGAQGLAGGTYLWMLRTSAQSGALSRHDRKALGLLAHQVVQAALSPAGTVTLAITVSYKKTTGGWRWTAGAYRTSTGRLIRDLHQFGPTKHLYYLPVADLSASGRYLVFYQGTLGLRRLNVATGAAATIKTAANLSGLTGIAW